MRSCYRYENIFLDMGRHGPIKYQLIFTSSLAYTNHLSLDTMVIRTAFFSIII